MDRRRHLPDRWGPFSFQLGLLLVFLYDSFCCVRFVLGLACFVFCFFLFLLGLFLLAFKTRQWFLGISIISGVDGSRADDVYFNPGVHSTFVFHVLAKKNPAFHSR